jgi:DHA1 family multidrug resistance protein-like MFS transporter
MADRSEPRSVRLLLILSLVGGAAIFSSTIAKNPVLPLLAQSLGADPAAIGLIAAASTVTGIATSLLAGRLSDRFGRRPLLIFSGIVFATAPFLYLFVTSPTELALVRAYHGLATAVFGPVASAYVTDIAPVRRGERLGYFSSAQLAGRSIAPAIGGVLIAVGSWEWVYLASAVAGVGVLAGMWPLREADPVEDGIDPIEAEVEGGGVASPAILATSVAEAGQYFAFGAIEAFLPLYALSVGVTPAVIGLLFAAQVGIRTLSRPLFGRLSDARGRHRPILTGLLVSAGATALLPFTTEWIGLLALSSVFGLGLSVAQAATQALVADAAPERERGAALGLMSTIMDIGQAAGPIAVGLLVSAFSYRAGFMGTALVVLGATAVFGLVVRSDPAR